MDAHEPYDWVDDDSLDMSAVMERFEALEPAEIITSRPPQTSAGAVVVVTRTVFGHSHGRPTFA